MKFLLLIFSILFTIEVMGQWQQQASQEAESFDVCSFLTDLSFYHRYNTLHAICYIRGYYIIDAQLGMLLSEEQCFEYLNKQILSKESRTQEELMDLVARYMAIEYRSTRSKELQSYWFSLEEKLRGRCGMELDITKELDAEQQKEKEQEVFKSVKCISKILDSEKQKNECTDES